MSFLSWDYDLLQPKKIEKKKNTVISEKDMLVLGLGI